jgi:type IV secretion system protein VirD4
MNSQNPVDLYLVVSPANLDRLRPLLRVFFNLALRKFTQKMEFENGQAVVGYKHRLLLMLDEFTSLGKLEIMQKALAFMAGYGVKAYIIVQDLSQLQEAYTRDESITSNCHVRIAYAPNKIETAKLLSDMTGKTTVVDKKISVSGKRLGGMGNASVSVSEVARPLLTPDECMRLKGPVKDEKGGIKTPGDMLIFVAGYNTVYGQQILYFLDPVFQTRVRIPPPDFINISTLKGISNNEI